MILAIDPGNVQSAWVMFHEGEPKVFGITENNALLYKLKYEISAVPTAIEMIASYGMAVGQTVFETVFWIGRFWEAREAHRSECTKIYRKDVKMHLCHSMRAKDANVRQAIIDRYPPTGGGKVPQVGTKSQPGPLFGVSKDVWAALGVAITFDYQQSLKGTTL